MYEDFYRAFEDKYRGSRELIKERLEVYLPFILPLSKIYPQNIAIDIGCGRGEWLELLGDNGIISKGVDSDTGMLDGAKERGLDITLGDGIEYLIEEPSNSALVISAFHLVEHLSFENLMKLIREANRVLVDGGILILETPNPENIKVASETFYLDPTHIKPIPFELLSFITQYNGYRRDKILRLQEDKSIYNQEFVNVGHIIEGVSPDYAVIAQKDASSELLAVIDEPFNREYGLSPLMLVEKFEARMLYLEQRLYNAEITIANQDIKLTNNSNNIENNSFYIERVLSLLKRDRGEIKTAQDTANSAHHALAHLQNAIKTAQDGVDYLVRYTQDIDKFAHHIADAIGQINNSIDNMKNSYSWRGLTFIERGLKKIKRALRKKGVPIITPIEEESIEKTIEMEKSIKIEDKNIEFNSQRAKEIYEKLNS